MKTFFTLFTLVIFLLLTGCQQDLDAGGENLTDQSPEQATEQNVPDPEPDRCTVTPPKDAMERMCTQQYDPVCGCNNKTYSNGCMAGLAGVSSSTPGACEQDQQQILD